MWCRLVDHHHHMLSLNHQCLDHCPIEVSPRVNCDSTHECWRGSGVEIRKMEEDIQL